MNSFNEIKQVKKNYNERLEELKSEKTELEEALSVNIQEYEARMEADALGTESFTNEAKLSNEIGGLRKEIEAIDNKIEIVRRGKRQAMANQVPVIREIRDNQKSKVEKEWNEAIESMQKAKAEFLLSIVALSEVQQKGNKVYSDAYSLITEANPETNERAKVYEPFEELPMNPNPSYFGHDVALRKAFSIPSWAVRDTFKGDVPSWVYHYMATGEINFDK